METSFAAQRRFSNATNPIQINGLEVHEPLTVTRD
jgi:hypothetical protein